jgi:hypothetical protein
MCNLELLVMQSGLNFLKDLHNLKVRFKMRSWYVCEFDQAIGTLNCDPCVHGLVFLGCQAKKTK